MKLGYACINMTLQQAGGITTNRGMRQKTFNERGLSYVSELALLNVKDLETIIKWNEEMGIKLFRMSSDIFPWVTYYTLQSLPVTLYQLPFKYTSKLAASLNGLFNLSHCLRLISSIL